jgi:pyruvate dehydrogenase E2 component (dihydrolipoamide acetyltransferase)
MGQRIFAVTMPKWGIEMQQGTIAEWHVAPGKPVEKGEHMLDVETDKIVNSVEAPTSGVVRRIIADKGTTENVGALIAVLAEPTVPDAEVEAFVRSFKPADARFELDAPQQETRAGAAQAAPEPRPADAAAAVGSEARISPIARRVAERLGIDLAKVNGTGRGGRISKEDVEAYAAAQGAAAAASAVTAAGSAAPAASPASASTRRPEPAREKLTSMRATIAKRLLESKQGIPHYRLDVDVDFNALLAHRSSLNAAGAAVSITDLLVRATALSLIRHPALNSQLLGDEVLKYSQADICVAVATDSGLIAPIVRGAEVKTAAQIGAELKDLAARARNGSLSREQITGGTFTISNLGMFGVDRFDAIINPPQVAILAVGAVSDRVVARQGAPAVKKVATLTLSADHRVVDGATAAGFLATLKSLIETAGSL